MTAGPVSTPGYYAMPSPPIVPMIPMQAPMTPPPLMVPQRQRSIDAAAAMRLLRMDQDVFGGLRPDAKARELIPALEAAVKANAPTLQAASHKILSDAFGLLLGNGVIHPAKWPQAQQLANATAEEIGKRVNAASWMDMMDGVGLTQENLGQAANQGFYYWA
ncbi:MAG: hypothetical protein IPK79_07675 [Vampirovibrionales bacterium]|nr:hypothetical protein [Vampirovibrionales bacterium]